MLLIRGVDRDPQVRHSKARNDWLKYIKLLTVVDGYLWNPWYVRQSQWKGYQDQAGVRVAC